eukprot:scaffold382231_cov28-Attheya_sp.AAC.1
MTLPMRERSRGSAINDIMVISVVRKLLRACGALLRLKHGREKEASQFSEISIPYVPPGTYPTLLR